VAGLTILGIITWKVVQILIRKYKEKKAKEKRI
jgi:hypothetical protein